MTVAACWTVSRNEDTAGSRHLTTASTTRGKLVKITSGFCVRCPSSGPAASHTGRTVVFRTDFTDHEAEKFEGSVAGCGVRSIEDIEEEGSHEERGIDTGNVQGGVAREEA